MPSDLDLDRLDSPSAPSTDRHSYTERETVVSLTLMDDQNE